MTTRSRWKFSICTTTSNLTVYSFSSLYIFVTLGRPTMAETCRQPNKTDTKTVVFWRTYPLLICIKHNRDDASKDYAHTMMLWKAVFNKTKTKNEKAGWRVHGPEKDGNKRMEGQSKGSRGLEAYCKGGQGPPRAVASSKKKKKNWIKIDQLDITCFIISLFTAQHVSNVSTSIFRSLRLIVDLFHVLYCSCSMCVGITVWFGWGGVVS